jgi:uncharacterized protein YkwD
MRSRSKLSRKAPHLALLLALAALLAPAGAAQAQGCANTHLRPTRENLDAVRDAVLCLHNRERARHGLKALAENPNLRSAAARHSVHMVDAHFFDHTTPSGRTMLDRVRRSGYLRRAHGFSIGENIAWASSGPLATAAEITSQWMSSAGHRANILQSKFREIGIGIQIGVPGGSRSGATYTEDFGFRR